MKFNILVVVGLCLASTSSFAQGRPSATPATRSQTPATSISSVTQGYKKADGFFPFYYDESTSKILLEVDKLDQEFLFFNSLSTGVGSGGPERGQGSTGIMKFIKVGPKVFLMQPNYNYRAITESKDEAYAVENNFASSIIFGFVPLAIEADKILIDLTPFIIRDSQKVGDRMTSRRGGASGGGAYRLDESRSTVFMENTKNFPKNTEFESLLTFTGSGGAQTSRRGSGGIAPDPTAITIRMHQSFVELPDPGYKPRKFDPRSGMNMHSYMDFSAPMTEPIVKRFSRRHRLIKKDPKAKMSEAVEPIIYYIDRGAPAPIKKALIEGGAWWNQAFEAAGYKDAFQVMELPEGADPMDIRYNIVNWINRTGSPRGFSSGASYTDPRTGEIIKGVITLGSDRHRQDYLIMEGILQPYEDGKPVSKQMEEVALARIRQLSAHEIGHTLGFFHNFAASIKGRASVMDYPFPKFTTKPDGTFDVSDAYAKGIGSWDKRSVIWGYSEFPAGANEDEELDKIIQENIKQGYQFIPDIGGHTHPNSHQWDDGENSIVELNRLMAARRVLLDRFSEKAIVEGAPMATLEEVLVPIYLLHRYQIEAVSKNVGGLYFTHALKNDGQTATKMVEPAEQWKALDALLATITPDALTIPEQLIQKIPPRPSGYSGVGEIFDRHTGPTFDPMAAAETAAGTTLAYLLNSERVARLIEYNARDSKQPGFMAVADKLIESTWKKPLESGYRGELQILVNNLTLKAFLGLAADTEASESVRGEALLKIDGLQKWMTSIVEQAPLKQKANLLFGLSQIGAFKANPDKFKPASVLSMPAGAPIMGGMDFLDCDVMEF
ncbi:uncharacterized protein DUF5117 [Dyadobacter jejuensis]|uniref:Uncharacterized protein DUF5117 n=1 Tax=Dyadobacter jejuensis TaxID=1082580 RepID=A0A316AF64_9BACT|nr:zinc-dependent metalloprotease [Dyadobacter jejuensis]PWJ55908.1 uncharacterized protein DUF5117 [Dyadobacter jejuensis]